MISFNIILAFLLSLPINPFSYPYGYNYVVSWGPKIVLIVITAKVIDFFFWIHIRLLAWMYRNNHRSLFKIYVCLILHYFDQKSCLNVQMLLNACMWHALSKDDDALLLFLLKCGADPNIIYREFIRSLPFPCIYDSIEHKDYYPNKSLLAEACQKNSTTLATILLQHHADPDGNVSYYKIGHVTGCGHAYSTTSSIDDCKNPLLIACHNNNIEIVKELIRYGTKTHPFIDTMRMLLYNTDIINMGDRSTILKDCMNRHREIDVSPIGFTLCNQNRDLFKMLLLYTLEKNNIIPAFYSFIQFALFHQKEDKSLQLLPKEVKEIIWSHIFHDITNANLIEKCFVRKESTWQKYHDYKKYTSIDPTEIEYWKNKLEIARFYSPLKVTYGKVKCEVQPYL